MKNKVRQLKKQEKGITLVALVVTIIVLLILAGVIINLSLGEDGIFKKAKEASDLYSEQAIREKLELMYVDYLIDGGYKDTEKDEIDIFKDIMGDKDITKEDLDNFNNILEQYNKKIIGITSVEDLKKIGSDPAYPLNGLYIQLNDISFNESDIMEPIGSMEEQFEGIYDGNAKKIENLKLNNEEENIGIFSVNKGKIKNVNVENVNINVAYSRVGTIAGANYGTIINCTTNNGSINSTGDNDGSRIGGIVGQNGEQGQNGDIINCTNNINVSAEYKLVGGIAGYSLGGNIENCKNYGEITGPVQVGGIAGDSEGLSENSIVTVKDCANYAKVTGNGSLNYEGSIGGIVGTNYLYSVLENNINKGSIVSNTSTVGGIVGSNFYKVKKCTNNGVLQAIYSQDIPIQRHFGGILGTNSGYVENCVNTAKIEGVTNNTDFIGGISGVSYGFSDLKVEEGVKIEKCYNTGEIIGNNYLGGICARTSATAEINSCYNTGNTTGNIAVGGLVGDTLIDAGIISNSYNKGKIISNSYDTGGLVGVIRSMIENCYNSGLVETAVGNDAVGGILGGIDFNYVGKEVVKNCYYLNTTCDKSCGNEEFFGGIEEAKAVTSEELKELSQKLGAEFKDNTEGDMYPKLLWE